MKGIATAISESQSEFFKGNIGHLKLKIFKEPPLIKNSTKS